MAHVRKEIRRVLDDMGFNNGFLICDESLEEFHTGGTLVVTIKDWEPHPDALSLKKRLQCCTGGGMDVRFEMTGASGSIAG